MTWVLTIASDAGVSRALLGWSVHGAGAAVAVAVAVAVAPHIAAGDLVYFAIPDHARHPEHGDLKRGYLLKSSLSATILSSPDVGARGRTGLLRANLS